MRVLFFVLSIAIRADNSCEKPTPLEKYSKNEARSCKDRVLFSTLCPLSKWQNVEINQISLFWTPLGSNIEYKFVVENGEIFLKSSTRPYDNKQGKSLILFIKREVTVYFHFSVNFSDKFYIKCVMTFPRPIFSLGEKVQQSRPRRSSFSCH